jgi:hypothetical protein
MQQKLVTIFLKDPDTNGFREEHLGDLVDQGWIIKELHPLNGSGGGETDVISGWIIVLLEK